MASSAQLQLPQPSAIFCFLLHLAILSCNLHRSTKTRIPFCQIECSSLTFCHQQCLTLLDLPQFPTNLGRGLTFCYQRHIYRFSREASSSSQTSRRGSPEDRWSVTKEDRLLVLEGTVLDLNSKFDKMLENNSKYDRILEELTRTRGGETLHCDSVRAPPPLPPLPLLQTPLPSRHTFTAHSSTLGLHHIPQMGMNSMGLQNPVPSFEPNLNQQQLQANLRTNLHIPQTEMGSMGSPNPMLSLDPNSNPQQFFASMRANPGQLPQFEQ